MDQLEDLCRQHAMLKAVLEQQEQVSALFSKFSNHILFR